MARKSTRKTKALRSSRTTKAVSTRGTKAVSTKRTAAVRSSRSTKAVSGRKSGRTSQRRAPAGSPKGGIHLICRECSFEFTLDPERAKSQQTLTCPVCEHRAQTPSNDILHQVSLYKGIERKNLFLALVFLVIGCVSILAWTMLTANQGRVDDPAIFYGPMGVAIVSAIIALVFGAKYERSRWDTYF